MPSTPPGAVSLQQCNVSGVQLLSGHQELHGDQGHLRLHPAAGDHRGLHHAVARHRSAAEESKSGLSVASFKAEQAQLKKSDSQDVFKTTFTEVVRCFPSDAVIPDSWLL